MNFSSSSTTPSARTWLQAFAKTARWSFSGRAAANCLRASSKLEPLDERHRLVDESVELLFRQVAVKFHPADGVLLNARTLRADGTVAVIREHQDAKKGDFLRHLRRLRRLRCRQIVP